MGPLHRCACHKVRDVYRPAIALDLPADLAEHHDAPERPFRGVVGGIDFGILQEHEHVGKVPVKAHQQLLQPDIPHAPVSSNVSDRMCSMAWCYVIEWFSSTTRYLAPWRGAT